MDVKDTFCQNNAHQALNIEDMFFQNDAPPPGLGDKKRGHLCDLTVKVRNTCFSVHRVIVHASIPYFLLNDEESEEVEITEPDIDSKAVDSLIDFAYGGKVKISVANVQFLLRASEFLQLDQVRDACLQFLRQRSNTVQVHKSGYRRMADLTEKCYLFVAKNFEELSRSQSFLHLPFACVQDIISRNDLKVSTEKTVFEAVLKWIKQSPYAREDMLPKLLGEVRMVYLPCEYLNERAATEELITDSEACMSLVQEVKNYYLFPEVRTVFSNLKTKPRKFDNVVYGFRSDHQLNVAVYCCDSVNKTWHDLKCEKKGDHVMNVVTEVEKRYLFFRTLGILSHFDAKTGEWGNWDCPIDTPHLIKYYTVAQGNFIYFFDDSGELHRRDARSNKCLEDDITTMNKWYYPGVLVRDSIHVVGGATPAANFETYDFQVLQLLAALE